ncbi:MAG: hypothetical protein Kow0069_34570 [Promethearchaeota archaeon]
MSIDYAGLIYQLMQVEPNITAAVVVGTDKHVVYQTDNWDVSGEIGGIVTSWMTAAMGGTPLQFVTLQGVKYSIFQMTPERLVAKNIREGHTLLGAKTPDGEYLLAYMGAEGSMMTGPADVARIANQMKTGGDYMAADQQMGTGERPLPPSTPASGVDPQLRVEIEGFIQWIKQADGLAYYLEWYINQNNEEFIRRFAEIYNKFRQIFNF